MPRASEFINETRTVEVKRDDKVLFAITYRPEGFTTDLEAAILKPETTDRDVCALLAEAPENELPILVEWDLTEDDDETRIPITADYLARRLGRGTVNGILAAIREDMTPTKKSRPRSRATSSATDSEDLED